jgi:hypothetical protein
MKYQCNECLTIFTGLSDFKTCPECEGSMHEIEYTAPQICKYCKKEHNQDMACREYVDSVAAPQTWIERFDKEWLTGITFEDQYKEGVSPTKIKAFIAAEIKTAQEEAFIKGYKTGNDTQINWELLTAGEQKTILSLNISDNKQK